jgi:hypothetical protein
MHVITRPIESPVKQCSQNLGPFWYVSAEVHWYSSDMRVQRFVSVVAGPGDGLAAAS